jgi:hypothetical protein
MFLGVAGLVLALIGLAALWVPIDLNQHDAYGFPIECGNGFSSNLSQVVQNNGGDVVTKCESALLTRRVWAIPSVAIGWLLVTVFLIAWARSASSARADLLS